MINFVEKIKSYWWVLGVVVAVSGAITFAVNLPPRLEAVEKKNIEQDTEIKQLTAINDTWQKIYQQQQQAHQVEEVEDDGEIKVLLMDGKKLCCSGRDCWAWTKRTKCHRSQDDDE